MRRVALASLVRWCDRPAGGRSDEDRAAALARESLLPGVLPLGLDDRQLSRIEHNLRRDRRVRAPMALRLVFVAALLVTGVASVMAFQSGWFSRSPAKDRGCMARR